MPIKQFVDNEEAVKGFAKSAEEGFSSYVSQRAEIDEKLKVADAMYAAMQNRSLLSSEKSKGMNMDKDTKANVGSPLFHRQVNVLAGLLVKVFDPSRDLFSYSPVSNPTVDLSYDESEVEAEQFNVLAKWTRRQDSFDARLPEWATSLFKYSIGFAYATMNREFRKVTEKIPSLNVTGQNLDGSPIYEVTEQDIEKDVMTRNHPSIQFIHPGRVYMDRYIPDSERQNLAIVLTLRSRSEIYSDVKSGIFSEENFKKIKPDMVWDGNFGSGLNREEATNRGEEYSPNNSMYLQWDVFQRLAVDDSGKIDEEQPDRLLWGTFIGNTIDGGICVRLEESADPDGEVPIKAVRVVPDRPDELYHTTISDIVRSAYSADCTLLNLALDNMGLVNDPPMTVIDGAHRIKDFTFKKGQKWHVDRHDAIKQFEVRDNTQATQILRRSIQDEIKQALNTDSAFMGEYAGARTSATEFMGVNQNSQVSQLIWIKYIAQQFLPWMAKKYRSYWKAFGGREQIIRITDSEKTYNISPTEIHGEFDIIVDIVDQFADDNIKQQQAQMILQTVASSPYLQQSPTHVIDVGEIMKEWLFRMGWKSDKIIRPPIGVDAELVARQEVFQMLNAGTPVQPQPGQDFVTHLRVEEAERLQWKGLENSGDPRAVNIALLDQHIAQEKQMMQQQAQAQQQQAQQAEGTDTTGQASAALQGSQV